MLNAHRNASLLGVLLVLCSLPRQDCLPFPNAEDLVGSLRPSSSSSSEETDDVKGAEVERGAVSPYLSTSEAQNLQAHNMTTSSTDERLDPPGDAAGSLASQSGAGTAGAPGSPAHSLLYAGVLPLGQAQPYYSTKDAVSYPSPTAHYQMFSQLGGYRGYVVPNHQFVGLHRMPNPLLSPMPSVYAPNAIGPPSFAVVQQMQPQASRPHLQYVPYLGSADRPGSPPVFHSMASPAYTSQLAQVLGSTTGRRPQLAGAPNPARRPIDLVRHVMSRYPNLGVVPSQGFAGFPGGHALGQQPSTAKPANSDTQLDIVIARQKKSSFGQETAIDGEFNEP